MSQNDQSGMPDITVPYDQFQLSGIAYWIEANGYKPHLLVNTRHPGVRLPPQCMAKEQEVINIHSNACGKFNWADDRMEFNARFGGREFHLIIPYHAILALNFAGTSYWIPTPWTVLAQAQGGEAVQITAVSDERRMDDSTSATSTALDNVDQTTLIEPKDVLGGNAPTALPDPVHGMAGATVVDMSSRFGKKKT